MIEFIEDIHTYLVEGVITPSVTQIINRILGNEYKSVPYSVLNAKADYGKKMHEWIENFCLTGEYSDYTPTMELSCNQAVNIIEKNKIRIKSCEEMICYDDYYAGTYDMYGTVKGKKSLIDIKTTAKYNKEYLEWQLGMYKLAVENSGGKVEKCYCLWLPKRDLAKLIEVEPKSKDDIIEMLEKLGGE